MVNSKSNLRKTLDEIGIKNKIKQSTDYKDQFMISFNSWSKAESILKKLDKEGFTGYRAKLNIHIKK